MGQSDKYPKKPEPKGLFRSLGEFVGHVSKAVRTPVAGANKNARAKKNELDEPTREVRRVVQEREAETPAGKVVLRRTTIDEVVEEKKAGKD